MLFEVSPNSAGRTDFSSSESPFYKVNLMSAETADVTPHILWLLQSSPAAVVDSPPACLRLPTSRGCISWLLTVKAFSDQIVQKFQRHLSTSEECDETLSFLVLHLDSKVYYTKFLTNT